MRLFLLMGLFIALSGCKSDEEKRSEFAASVASGVAGCTSQVGSVTSHVEVLCDSTTTSEDWIQKIQPALTKKCDMIAPQGFDVFLVTWGGSHRDSIKCKK